MSVDDLVAHLQTGTTHTCHCWAITRQDGMTLGFTDHDMPLRFDDITFAPQTGLSAKALVSSTGLSVNNTEAVGALTSDAITEADIYAGRFDGADVIIWLVRWDDTQARKVLFRGQLGEITREAGAFQAELLGLTAALNQLQGRSYIKQCSAVLGDNHCRVGLDNPAYRLDYNIDSATDGQVFVLSDVSGFQPAWFEGGHFAMLTGAAASLTGLVKSDVGEESRKITLWTPISAPIQIGDQLRLTAGCDKQPKTCREKFGNFVNFRGFPDIPSDDWLVSVPRSEEANSGGSLTR